jgi:homoserine dehydrogenase
VSVPRPVPLLVLGVGNVGRAFLTQLIQTRAALAERYSVDLQPVALADSSGAILNPDGLSDTLEAVVAAKKGGQSLAGRPGALAGIGALDLIKHTIEQGIGNAIVIDTSASEQVTGALHYALEQNYGVVLANKRPLAGPWQEAQVFFGHPYVRFEATVCAGVPVIYTLRYLVDTGDSVQRIEGSLSGTLGYLCSCLEDGEAFSTVVQRAKDLGYTEPDPREDLSGLDVARKVLILGRLAGWPLELDQLEVDPLYPAEMAEMSLGEFMQRLPSLDFDFAAYTGALDGVPRYMAEVGPEGGVVSLRMVDDRLAAQLRGTLNQVTVWTGRYAETPLSLTGPGAGIERTAAAVLQDCLQIAQNAPSPGA